MKKFFLFAAAAVAALTVNAKVINFAEIIDKTDAASAKSSCDAAFSLINLTSEGKPNSKGTAYCAEITQTEGTRMKSRLTLHSKMLIPISWLLKHGLNTFNLMAVVCV